MPIIQNVTLHQFCQAFEDMGRGNQFSPKGLELLYTHLEDMSYNIDSPIELDVIALCCDYSEYDGIDDLREQLGFSKENYPEWEDILAELENGTEVIADDYDDPSIIIVGSY